MSQDKSGTTDLKRRSAFCFVDGELTVLGTGHINEGDGWFTFDETVIDWEPHDEKSGSYLIATIPKSELIAMRDFLNAQFPQVAESNV